MVGNNNKTKVQSVQTQYIRYKNKYDPIVQGDLFLVWFTGVLLVGVPAPMKVSADFL